MSNPGQQELIPGAFEFRRCTLTNYAGEEIDIQELISEVVVTESIYSMFCLYEFTIVDGTALLERFAISGNEKIELELSKIDDQQGPDIITTKSLLITSISDYDRVINESQVYVIHAISETALNASITRASKSVAGSPTKIIKELYDEVQYRLPLTVSASAQGNYKIVLPNYTYADIFSMLLNKAQATSGTTFHLFETLWGNVDLTSYNTIIDKPSVDEYQLKSFESTETDTDVSAWDQIRRKITNIESNLGISRFEAFRNGGISTRVFAFDIATKTFTKTDFTLPQESPKKMDKDFLLDPSYRVSGKSISQIKQPKTHMVHQNTMAYNTGENLQNRVADTIAKKRMQYENQYAVSQFITLVGDSRLRAGNTLDLLLPTPTDPSRLSENRDEYFSGKYFISSVRHSLKTGGSYIVEVTARKDSIDRTKMVNKYKGKGI